MHELASLLCASAIELRSGGLTAEMLRRDALSHHLALHFEAPEEAAKAAEKVFEKYPSRPFHSTLLEQTTIVDLILKSRLTKKSVQHQLRQHSYFAKPEEMPSGRALWLGWEAPAQEHDSIVKRFQADFAARAFRAKAEINHVIGLIPSL